MKRPALVVWFPKPFWWHPNPNEPWRTDWPVLPADADARFPELIADFTVWRDKIEWQFRLLDHHAQLLQNRFWRQQVTLIIGGLAVMVLGAWQAASGGGHKGIAAAQAVLAGLLTGLTVLVRDRRAQQGYLTAQLKAERIKSEFFLFLGRVGGYGEDDREERLRRQVEDIAGHGAVI